MSILPMETKLWKLFMETTWLGFNLLRRNLIPRILSINGLMSTKNRASCNTLGWDKHIAMQKLQCLDALFEVKVRG